MQWWQVTASKMPCQLPNRCDPEGSDVGGRTVACMTTGWRIEFRDMEIERSKGASLTSHRIGENNTFPHFGRAQVGVPDFAFLPVMTEHSVLKCRSIRMFGS